MTATEVALLQLEPTMEAVAAEFVDDEKGIELDDLMQEGRIAAFLLIERELTPVRPWHFKLVMRNWVSHIRNPEVGVDTEFLVDQIERRGIALVYTD